MESSSAPQLGLQLDNSIFQSLQLNLVNLVSWRGIQIPRLDLQRTFTENKKIYSPNLSSQNRRKILVRPLAFLFPCSSWAPSQPTILNQNQSPLASLATHSMLRGPGPQPFHSVRCADHFCQKTFCSKLKDTRLYVHWYHYLNGHLFYCVLLVPEYLVWFVSSCIQANSAAPQGHSCFSIHSTGLWRTLTH